MTMSIQEIRLFVKEAKTSIQHVSDDMLGWESYLVTQRLYDLRDEHDPEEILFKQISKEIGSFYAYYKGVERKRKLAKEKAPLRASLLDQMTQRMRLIAMSEGYVNLERFNNRNVLSTFKEVFNEGGRW